MQSVLVIILTLYYNTVRQMDCNSFVTLLVAKYVRLFVIVIIKVFLLLCITSFLSFEHYDNLKKSFDLSTVCTLTLFDYIVYCVYSYYRSLLLD